MFGTLLLAFGELFPKFAEVPQKRTHPLRGRRSAPGERRSRAACELALADFSRAVVM